MRNIMCTLYNKNKIKKNIAKFFSRFATAVPLRIEFQNGFDKREKSCVASHVKLPGNDQTAAVSTLSCD